MSMEFVSAREAVNLINSGDRVFIHTAAATPQRLVDALAQRGYELENVEIVSAHTEGEVPYAKWDFENSFKISCFFVGSNIRPYVHSGRAHYVPIFLSEIPTLFRSGKMKVDVALITVSPPNDKGFCSLGCSVDISNAAADTATVVIAEINPNMPFVHGNGIIHIKNIHATVYNDSPLHEIKVGSPSEIEETIGQNVAELVEDGSTLQLGIGAIPNSVLSKLNHHNDLGIHSEMISDGIIPLVENEVITGSRKTTDPGKIVSGFCLGTRKLYDFIDHNPLIELRDVGYVNDTRVIRQNPKMVAINSALEIDVYGQVCADSIGTKQYSGVGGQMDFIRGAALSEGGKPILALPSRTSNGTPRIVPTLRPGASVVTTRAHVHYVVTEFGVAYLYAKNLKERFKQMVNVAHPDDRDWLSETIYENTNVLI
ncbi:MAG: acetyl-CoA hydrolase/transferase C-terminal domain-containing protein [Bacteroidota bacterium]